MTLNLPLAQETTEDLVRCHRGLRKLLGSANILVRALQTEIRSRKKKIDLQHESDCGTLESI